MTRAIVCANVTTKIGTKRHFSPLKEKNKRVGDMALRLVFIVGFDNKPVDMKEKLAGLVPSKACQANICSFCYR
jgi:hypothetical protein